MPVSETVHLFTEHCMPFLTELYEKWLSNINSLLDTVLSIQAYNVTGSEYNRFIVAVYAAGKRPIFLLGIMTNSFFILWFT